MSVVGRKDSYQLIHKQNELVAPDGGWGYLVAVAAFLTFTTTTAFMGSFGLLYNDFMTETRMSSASVTLLLGMLSVSVALTGFFTSPLLSLMSTRKLAFIAAVVYSLGVFGTVVMTSPFVFIISQGVMQGAGMGILYNLTCTIINDYFINKRVLITNIIQTVIGVATMIVPMFLKWSLEEYGARGTLLLIAGISLHNFLAVFIMQPVQWHMRKVDVLDEADNQHFEEKFNKAEKVDSLVIKLSDEESPIELAAEMAEKVFDFPEEDEKKSRVRKALESLIDISLCKTFLLSCASIGTATCITAEGIYMVMLPRYLFTVGWSQDNVALMIALTGFGDLAMRVIFTFVSKWMNKLGVQQIYIVGIALAVVARVGMLCSSSVTAVLFYSTLMGAAHCFIAVLMPLVISDAVEPEKFTSAMGLCLLFSGILGIALGPAVGALRDLTDSYVTALYTVTSFYAIIAVLWPVELFINKHKRRKILSSSSKSSQLNKVPR